MRAWVIGNTGVLSPGSEPLQLVDLPIPIPLPGEVRIRVSACGVCHTELDEIEGRVLPPKLPVVPGHQVVGIVDEAGDRVTRHKPGDCVGIGWIHHSSGEKNENLSEEFVATGCDINGGYAEYMTVPEMYAYPIPAAFTSEQAAPLLCAGAVGYRSLLLTELQNGQALGLTGFGGSAHIVMQLVRHLYPDTRVYVFARDAEARTFAIELGATWTGDTVHRCPVPLDAIIDTTPAWRPVLEALSNLKPGGRLVINAIRKEDADRELMASISYREHLWMEKEIKSVANVTHYDLAEFLPLADAANIRPEVQVYPLEDANKALIDLKFKPVRGAKVLILDQ